MASGARHVDLHPSLFRFLSLIPSYDDDNCNGVAVAVDDGNNDGENDDGNDHGGGFTLNASCSS